MSTTVSRVSRSRVYHTDPDCPELQRGSTVYEYDRDIAELHWRECKRCSGQQRNPSGVQNDDCSPSDPPEAPTHRPDSNVHMGHVWTRDGFRKVG